MDLSEALRRFRRQLEVHTSARRVFIVLFIFVVLLWLFGYNHLPYPHQRREATSPIESCLEMRLSMFDEEVKNMDTKIIHTPTTTGLYHLPYVGNGYIGVEVNQESAISIKPYRGRTLSLHTPFRPIVQISLINEEKRAEAMVLQNWQGAVHRFICIEADNGGLVEISSSYFAHRTNPSVFEQNISISNPSRRDALVQLEQMGLSSNPPFKSEQKQLNVHGDSVSYIVLTGVVVEDKRQMLVAIAYKKVPNAVQVSPHDSVSVRLITVVNYIHLASKREFDRIEASLIEKTEKELELALKQEDGQSYFLHVNAWKDLWSTGFYISHSKAEDALNGDRINATMYYVLSQVRAPLHEIGVSNAAIVEANAVLSYAEGCYGGHHTLQAPSLWPSIQSEPELLRVCNLWLLTMEKLGCHKLLRAGASGVIQGMVLSFGALKFRNSHLEFNTEPKDLHRDYRFRRILYGNSTHLNISVEVGDDNKAVIFAALDRKDKDYFACDAGCMDTPVELGMQKQQFPVKITDPVTSILYITSDRVHAEELHLSIHVKEILEAPAHEHHVISMHKHGSGYSATSTMFWVLLSLIIIGFHIYLFHLVYSEFFGASSQDRYRSRKVSDF